MADIISYAWRLAAGGWRLAAGSWRFAIRDSQIQRFRDSEIRDSEIRDSEIRRSPDQGFTIRD